jgi:endo-1,4-beta-xylanase
MRLRHLLTIGTGAAAVLALTTAALAAPDSGNGRPPRDSLRALAAKIGLRIGTAVIPFDLDQAN